jgi:dynactin-5
MATDSSSYIITTTQNYVSRMATLHNASSVRIKGKSIISAGVTIHGDAPIQIGRYCHIHEGVVIKPTAVPISSDALLENSVENERSLQLIIGSHTTIGENTTISSLSVGSNVRIGKNCILSPRSKIFDCCVIEDGSIITEDMIVPPFSRVAGSPARVVGTLPECCGHEFVEGCMNDYAAFVKSLGMH